MNELTLDQYQKDAIASRDCPNIPFYLALGLTGKVGDISNKLKKFWRDKYYTNAIEMNKANVGTQISQDDLVIAAAHRMFIYEDLDGIRKELGDTLWYIAAIADSLGMKLSEVAYQNLSKCKKRWKPAHCMVPGTTVRNNKGTIKHYNHENCMYRH